MNVGAGEHVAFEILNLCHFCGHHDRRFVALSVGWPSPSPTVTQLQRPSLPNADVPSLSASVPSRWPQALLSPLTPPFSLKAFVPWPLPPPPRHSVVLPDGRPHAAVPDNLHCLQRHLGTFVTAYCNKRKLPVAMGEKIGDELSDFLLDSRLCARAVMVAVVSHAALRRQRETFL